VVRFRGEDNRKWEQGNNGGNIHIQRYSYSKAQRLRNSIRKGRANKRDWDHRPMAAATGAVEITLPVAIVAAAYIIGQAMVGAGKDG